MSRLIIFGLLIFSLTACSTYIGKEVPTKSKASFAQQSNGYIVFVITSPYFSDGGIELSDTENSSQKLFVRLTWPEYLVDEAESTTPSKILGMPDKVAATPKTWISSIEIPPGNYEITGLWLKGLKSASYRPNEETSTGQTVIVNPDKMSYSGHITVESNTTSSIVGTSHQPTGISINDQFATDKAPIIETYPKISNKGIENNAIDYSASLSKAMKMKLY